MNRQHPQPHTMGNRVLIAITDSEIWAHCQNLLDDPRTKNTLFNLLIRETSQFLCYERLLNLTYVAYKNTFFRKMQFWSLCYTVVSYQALFRLSVYKIPAVYLLGAKNVSFCKMRDFGSPTIPHGKVTKHNKTSHTREPRGQPFPTHI